MKHSVNSLLDTLGENDFVNVGHVSGFIYTWSLQSVEGLTVNCFVSSIDTLFSRSSKGHKTIISA